MDITQARQITALDREVLGGNGVLLDYRVMRRLAEADIKDVTSTK